MPKIANQWLRDVLSTLYQRRTSTRWDLIENTGLNPASVSHALRYLLKNGTILKVGELQSNGSRPREVFSLNAEAGYFVAVDLEGCSVRFALTNFVGDIRCRWETDFDLGQSLPVQKILDGISRVLRDLDAGQKARVIAVGVSYPGLLDENGLLTAWNLGWKKFPLLHDLRTHLDYPVFFEHEKHTCVHAERWLGCAQDYESGAFIAVERGIGLGIFVDGEPMLGWRGMSGELGHCKVDFTADDLCECGQTGCLEAIASSPNIVRQFRQRCDATNGRVTHVTDVFQKARKGNSDALAVIERAGRALGRALATVVSLMNPQIIVFGGDAMSGEDVLIPFIEQELRRHTMPELLEGVKITTSSLGLDIRLRGAASLAFRKSLVDAELLALMCSRYAVSPA